MLKEKTKKINFKKALLSVGGLTLVIGMPLGLVIACSPTEEVASEIENIENIKPDSNGYFSSTITGWNIEAVADHEHSSVLHNLDANSSYRLRFTLKHGYTKSRGTHGLILNSDGSYYSTSSYSGIIAHDLNVYTVDAIKSDENGVINVALNGWNIEVVDGPDSDQVLTSLINGTSYYLKFTLLSGFYVFGNFDGELSTSNTYYSSEKIHQNYAAEISRYVNFLPNENAEISETVTGWDISIVSTTNLEVPLSSLSVGDTYFIKFTLQSEFTMPDFDSNNYTNHRYGRRTRRHHNRRSNHHSIDYTNYLSYVSGSYYSSVKTFQALAGYIGDATQYIPDANAKISETIVGWDIDLVTSIGSDQVLTDLAPGVPYYVRFKLQSGYVAASEQGILSYWNGNYYSSRLQLATAIESTIGESFKSDVTINLEDASTNQPYIGWTITVVDSNEPYNPLTVIDDIDSIRLKFVLNPGYIASKNIEGLNPIYEGTNITGYITVSTIDVSESIAQDISDIDAITLNQIGEVIIPILENETPKTFVGWGIKVVNEVGSSVVLNKLSTGMLYVLKFTLLNEFIAPSELNGLTINEDGSYYSEQKVYLLASELGDHVENTFSTTVTIDPLTALTSHPYNGWTISLVNEIGGDLYSSIETGDSYYVQFSLKVGYSAPTSISDNLTKLYVKDIDASNYVYYISTQFEYTE